MKKIISLLMILPFMLAEAGAKGSNELDYIAHAKNNNDNSLYHAGSNNHEINSFAPPQELNGIWLEAECSGNIGSNWVQSTDALASGGTYLKIQDLLNSTTSVPTGSGDKVSYKFDVPTSGTYYFYVRTEAPTGRDNSFYISINGQEWNGWTVNLTSDFSWNKYGTAIQLSAGTNTFDIAYREDGTLIDKFFISMSSVTPSGLGETAVNCGQEPDPAPAETTKIWLESECPSSMGASWVKNTSDQASNSSYLETKNGYTNTSAVPTISEAFATYNFEVSQAGTYFLLSRTMAPNGGANSFYVRVNGGTWIDWHLTQNSNFIWNSYNKGFALKAGTNKLEIAYREDGTKIDKFLFNSELSKPDGMGGDASNCSEEAAAPNEAPTVDAGSDKSLTLPENSVTLSAKANDNDGEIVTYAWTQLEGPSNATLKNGSTSTLTASNLLEGTYKFEVMVKDDQSASATDAIQVTVIEPVNEGPGDSDPGDSDIVINNVINVTSNMTIDKRWDVESHTHIKGNNKAVVKINGTVVRGGFVTYGVKDIIFEDLIIDIHSERNFVTGIFLEKSSNIIIRNCKFINSRKASADPDWTLHGINARDIKNVQVYNNYSDGCQLKLDGGSFSAENVSITDNYIREATQMGISVVAQPHSSEVIMKDIVISRNTMEKIDQHAIYVGVDHGKAEYAYKTIVENITIEDNVIGELAYLNTHQVSKGILINATKDSRNIVIRNNKIKNTVYNEEAIGIQLRCTDGGFSDGLDIKNNEISGFGWFNMFIQGAGNIDITNNYMTQGKGIIIKDSKDGEIYNNYFTGTSGKVRVENSSNIKY